MKKSILFLVLVLLVSISGSAEVTENEVTENEVTENEVTENEIQFDNTELIQLLSKAKPNSPTDHYSYALREYYLVATTQKITLTEYNDQKIFKLSGIIGSAKFNCGTIELTIISKPSRSPKAILKRDAVKTAVCDI